MSIISDKKNVLTQISVLTSIGQTIDSNDVGNSFSSVNNKKEAIPFLLDMLVKLKGSDAVEKATGSLLTNFVKKSEPSMKSNLKTQLLPFNSNQSIPPSFTTGYDIPVKSIDSFNKLKTDPNTNAGSLIYSDSSNNFDKNAYNAIRSPGTEIPNGNTTIRYNEISNTFTIKPTNTSQTTGQFLNQYVDDMEIINAKEFNTQVTNEIFGNITSNQNKTYEQIVAEQRIKKLIEKMVNNEDDLNLTDEEITQIQKDSENLEKGINLIDLGCGFFDSSINLDDTKDFIYNISGSTNPEFVGNAYSGLLYKSLNGQDLGKNITTARDSFFKRIIKKIIEILVTALTATPQIMLLKLLIETFKNNGNLTIPSSTENDIKSSKNISECLANSVKSEINKFFFNAIKVELIKIVKNSSKVILREKLTAFSNILKSLSF